MPRCRCFNLKHLSIHWAWRRRKTHRLTSRRTGPPSFLREIRQENKKSEDYDSFFFSCPYCPCSLQFTCILNRRVHSSLSGLPFWNRIFFLSIPFNFNRDLERKYISASGSLNMRHSVRPFFFFASCVLVEDPGSHHYFIAKWKRKRIKRWVREKCRRHNGCGMCRHHLHINERASLGSERGESSELLRIMQRIEREWREYSFPFTRFHL